MYINGVIKDLTKLKTTRGLDERYSASIDIFLRDLKTAESFHFPSELGLSDIFKKYQGKSSKVFKGELSKEVRVPYKRHKLFY